MVHLPDSLDPQFRNYVTVVRGLAYVGNALEPYTTAGLQCVHHKASSVVGDRCSSWYPSTSWAVGKGRCSDNGSTYSRWCSSCDGWRIALRSSFSADYNFTNWKKTESWKWESDYLAIAPIFLPSFWKKGKPIKLNDLSTACHVWRQCNEFKISPAVREKVAEFRNIEFGHNTELRIDDAKKTEIFNELKSLMHDPDVQAHIDIGKCIDDLDSIASEDQIEELIKEIITRFKELKKQNAKINNTLEELKALSENVWKVCSEKAAEDAKRHAELLDAINNQGQENKIRQNEIRKQLGEMKEQNDKSLHDSQRAFKEKEDKDTERHSETVAAINTLGQEITRNLQRFGTKLWTTLVIAVIAILVAKYFPWSSDQSSTLKYIQQGDCFPENYSHPFPQDLPLLDYLNEHSELFGRNWLFHDLEEHFDNTKSPDKGVLITAALGYGKSAIVKHLLCAGKDSGAHKIRSRIVAFHLCKSDVLSTKDPHRFIKRLIGFMATKFPEFRDIVSTIPKSALLYDQEKCKKEIVACFDQGILHPLEKMKNIETGLHIIIFDALDECYDKQSNDNDLYYLLKARYRKLPRWIKFIITSRNISMIQDMHKLKMYNLEVRDERNIADVKQYTEYKVNCHPNLRNDAKKFDSIFEQGEGYFLFIVRLIEHVTSSNEESINKIPDKLSELYEMNFDRYFNSPDEYEIAKSILEIIIASLHPLNKHELFDILEGSNVSKLDIEATIEKKISFCFRPLQDITFVHQSLELWLMSEESRQFRISVEKGHMMMSRYLLNNINHSRADIVDVAIHVANSNNSTLIKLFATTFDLKDVAYSTIHQLVWKSDSATALELIINLGVNVDMLNEGNVTAAFVASSRGHLNQLQYLKARGANLNFKVDGSYLITSPDQLEDIKLNHYFGYGLVHIATQFGHLEIVKYLINHDKSMLKSVDSMGLSAAEIACEEGHLHLLQLYMDYETEIGRCLFFAARSGQTDIVNKLAHQGINVSCVSQTDALKALDTLDSENTSKTLITSKSIFGTFNPYDLWMIAYQQSPLHVAIKGKNTDTALKLIEYFPHLNDCVDAFGMTPFLLSAFENQTSVFERLIERVTKDTCQNTTVNKLIEMHSNRPVCPAGGTYAHIDGIYGRSELSLMLVNRHINIDWLVPDFNSVTAVHYAACQGNLPFLSFVKNITELPFSSMKSSNQSTPFHSAAICGKKDAILEMKDSLKGPVPNVVDSNKRTVLHYIVMREFHEETASLDKKHQENSLEIFKNVLESGFGINHFDIYMRNVLHYALKNGHYLILEYIYLNLYADYKYLLKQVDIDGLSPIEYAVRTVAYRNLHKMIKPPICKFYDIFFTDCDTGDIEDYLNSWETGLTRVLKTVASDKLLQANELRNMFKDIILKSPYVTSAALFYLRELYDVDQIRKQFLESLSESPPHESILALARYYPDLFTVCGKLLSKSPVHLMAYKYSTVTDVNLASEYKYVPIFATDSGFQMFVSLLKKTAFSCADSRGYNSLHYSLFSGNIEAALTLFHIGVPVTNSNVSINDILWMILLQRKRDYTAYDGILTRRPCPDQLKCINIMLGLIFKEHLDNTKYSDFCLENSVSLSLIHIFAASDLGYSMNILQDKFGSKIMECQNKDGITPLYLWDILNSEHSGEIFQLTTKYLPNPDTEELLLLGLLDDFPFNFYRDRHVSMNFKLYPYECILNENFNSKLESLKCFSRLDSHIRKTIDFQNLKRMIYVQLDFSVALLAQQPNLSDILQDVKVGANAFEIYFRKNKMSFNYPRLRELISLTFDSTSCKSEGQMTIQLPCLQLSIELNNMLNRVIEYNLNLFMISSLHVLKSSYKRFPVNAQFIYKRLNQPHASPSNHNILSKPAFINSNKQRRVVFRHRYLNVLQQTVKYKYMKNSYWSRMTYSVPLRAAFQTSKENIPQPLNDILKHINSSSYPRDEL